MRNVFLAMLLALTSLAFSQQPIGKPQDKKDPILNQKVEFSSKIDTISCSFLYVSDDGYILSDRGFIFRLYMHAQNMKDIDVNQVLVNEKGVVVEQKRVVQIIQFDWSKPKKQ